ncbi:hypothetical protein LS68_000390 [Helicobacter sp. MIT 05-5293]|uniref:hypothetical protein n=1 Tax=Helicobacter sp. MIT 05-5293 TaxID=1548149 RepID=UPI00051D5F3E|nr:hypothetical protein [Helicobacter sp. MIT 05-5293]TLD81538.1 hypothetical protein LS68_000390 [Helicobacter sp. MIT 05-5293]
MAYDYNPQKRFSKKNAPYSYIFVDSHYKSDGVAQKGGRKFKAFFDEMCSYIFDINLALLENTGDFPIVYNERSNSATIAIALSCQTPYVISEMSIDRQKLESGKEEDQNSKGRLDFWCCTDDRDGKKIAIWIESKHLWLNIGKKAQRQFTSGNQNRIKEAMKQLRDAAIYQKDNDYNDFNLALFSINIFCKREQAPNDLHELDSVNFAKEIMDMILESAQEAEGIEIDGILCGVLDLRPSIDTDEQDTYHIYSAEYMPFVLLCGVVSYER